MFFKGIRMLSPDRRQEAIVFEKYPSGGAGIPAQGTGCAAFSPQVRGSAVFVVPQGKGRQVAPCTVTYPLHSPGEVSKAPSFSTAAEPEILSGTGHPAVGAVGSRGSPCFVPLPSPSI